MTDAENTPEEAGTGFNANPYQRMRSSTMTKEQRSLIRRQKKQIMERNRRASMSEKQTRLRDTCIDLIGLDPNELTFEMDKSKSLDLCLEVIDEVAQMAHEDPAIRDRFKKLKNNFKLGKASDPASSHGDVDKENTPQPLSAFHPVESRAGLSRTSILTSPSTEPSSFYDSGIALASPGSLPHIFSSLSTSQLPPSPLLCRPQPPPIFYLGRHLVSSRSVPGGRSRSPAGHYAKQPGRAEQPQEPLDLSAVRRA